MVEANKHVVRALARALIDHPERTLDGDEIDEVISRSLHREASANEIERRARWRLTMDNAARFSLCYGN